MARGSKCKQNPYCTDATETDARTTGNSQGEVTQIKLRAAVASAPLVSPSNVMSASLTLPTELKDTDLIEVPYRLDRSNVSFIGSRQGYLLQYSTRTSPLTRLRAQPAPDTSLEYILMHEADNSATTFPLTSPVIRTENTPMAPEGSGQQDFTNLFGTFRNKQHPTNHQMSLSRYPSHVIEDKNETQLQNEPVLHLGTTERATMDLSSEVSGFENAEYQESENEQVPDHIKVARDNMLENECPSIYGVYLHLVAELDHFHMQTEFMSLRRQRLEQAYADIMKILNNINVDNRIIDDTIASWARVVATLERKILVMYSSLHRILTGIPDLYFKYQSRRQNETSPDFSTKLRSKLLELVDDVYDDYARGPSGIIAMQNDWMNALCPLPRILEVHPQGSLAWLDEPFILPRWAPYLSPLDHRNIPFPRLPQLPDLTAGQFD